MINENIVAQIKPPMTTRANGLELSEPIPVDIAAGNNPIIAMSAVINTGRTNEVTPILMAE